MSTTKTGICRICKGPRWINLGKKRNAKSTKLCGKCIRENRPLVPQSVRFWKKVTKTDSCWAWNAATHTHAGNYGSFNLGPTRCLAHRFAYENLVGPIPEGKQLDHLCRNRKCVNPAHLEIVTIRINTLRGIGPTAVNARKTICKRGHPLNEQNTYVNPKGYRQCRPCKRIKDKLWRRANEMAEAFGYVSRSYG